MQVSICPLKPGDASELQNAILGSVGHIRPWLDCCSPTDSLVDARAWVAESHNLWQEGASYRWVITDVDKRQIMGSVEISRWFAGDYDGRMGYWVGRVATGQGICTEAAAMALSWAFEQGSFERVDLFIRPNNAASIGVAAKLGSDCRGKEDGQIVYRGEAKLANRYSIDAGDFRMSSTPLTCRPWPLTKGFSSKKKTPPYTRSLSDYEFRRFVKNTRV